MKLVIDGEIYCWHHGGGISRVFNELIPRLRGLGVEVIVGVKQHTEKTRIAKDVLPSVQWIPQLSPRLRPWRIWSRIARILNPVLVRQFWRRKSADIFMSTYYTDPPVAARKICVVYDMIFELFPQCFEEDFWKMTLQRQREAIVSADKIICVSENTRKDIVRLWGVSENRCRTIYIGGATAQAAGEEGPVSHDKPFLLYVGDFRCAYKNFEFVLAGLGPEAGKTSAGLDLVVVSRVVPNEEEKTRFASLLSPERLRFVPDCSDGELRAYYRDCAAFIYPSLYEGFGLPVQEALCQGAPVVCSNAASLPEVGGDAVYYFDPTSAMQFRQALDQALAEGWNDSVVFRRKAQAALFSWDRTAKDYVAVFREVCDPHFINAAKV